MSWMGPEHLPRILSQPATDQSACSANYDNNQSCDSEIDGCIREYVDRVEGFRRRTI